MSVSTVATGLWLWLVSALSPTLEKYCSEMWACNKCQIASLESIHLGEAEKVFAVLLKRKNEAVRGEVGLEFLKSRYNLRGSIK